MNAAQHFQLAETLVDRSDQVDIADGWAQLLASQAQVHATLALAATLADIQKRVP